MTNTVFQNLLALASKPLTSFWPNPQQTLILGQYFILTRYYFGNFENQPKR